MPDYRLPLLGLLRFAPDFFLARPRSFAQDGRRVMVANPYRRRIEGLEQVPRRGPFILVMNHYNRRGLRPQICAFLVSATLAELRPDEPEISWLFAGELERFLYAPIPVPRGLMRWMFRRIDRVYGLVAMPREWRSPLARAAALRRIARKLESTAIGLTPEAGGPGILREPPAGSGLLLLSLNQRGPPILPVGIHEEDDTLVIRFGEPFHLAPLSTPSTDERDRLAIRTAMMAIGRLLPESYQGVYREAIAAAPGMER